jgi:hypothetical protein
MRKSKLHWIAVALVVAALLSGAWRIVEQRNSAFFLPGEAIKSMPLH